MLFIEWRYYKGGFIICRADDDSAAKKIDLAATEPGQMAVVLRDSEHFEHLYTAFAAAYLNDRNIAAVETADRWHAVVVWLSPTVRELAHAAKIINKYLP